MPDELDRALQRLRGVLVNRAARVVVARRAIKASPQSEPGGLRRQADPSSEPDGTGSGGRLAPEGISAVQGPGVGPALAPQVAPLAPEGVPASDTPGPLADRRPSGTAVGIQRALVVLLLLAALIVVLLVLR
jgi:hypothetical protein